MLTAVMMWSCSDDDIDSKSIFDTPSNVVQNDFDKWLLTNYVKPYNIEFKYHFEDKESDMSYNLAPADFNKSIAIAKLVKYLWLDAYEEVSGKDFIRTYCPKIINLIGSPAYNSQGEIVLGTAEGGLKITLYNINNINLDKINIEDLNYWYFKTMHHEFAHILHQTKSYPTDFDLISASNYQSSAWVNMEKKDALNAGFVSTYGSSEPREDFVEYISIYVTSTADAWNTLVESAGDKGKPIILQKLSIVKDYMKTTWGIDLDELRSVVQRRSLDVVNMDLSKLD